MKNWTGLLDLAAFVIVCLFLTPIWLLCKLIDFAEGWRKDEDNSISVRR